jgi:cell division protein ZapA (FtsZ GTPase activity inhibitor)
MATSVSLPPEEMRDYYLDMKANAEKHDDGVRKIKGHIRDLETILKGGQGDAVINALEDLSKAEDEVKNINDFLSAKMAAKIAAAENMQEDTASHKRNQDDIQAAAAKAKNAI